jgi:hypothetical protein
MNFASWGWGRVSLDVRLKGKAAGFDWEWE